MGRSGGGGSVARGGQRAQAAAPPTTVQAPDTVAHHHRAGSGLQPPVPEAESGAARCPPTPLCAPACTRTQLKGNVFRTKTVVVQEAVFNSMAEAHRLGGALEQWQRAAEGAVAAAAVDMRVAELRLAHATSRQGPQGRR